MIKMITIFFMGLSLAGVVSGCTGMRPAGLGVKDGKFSDCPPSPNCVSSQSTDKEHYVDPLRFTGSVSQASADLKKVILSMKRARIAEENESYIHAEFTSAIWRFVDDVEFFFDDATKTIQLRSASRLGHSDFGVNRERVEEIRTLWNSAAK